MCVEMGEEAVFPWNGKTCWMDASSCCSGVAVCAMLLCALSHICMSCVCLCVCVCVHMCVCSCVCVRAGACAHVWQPPKPNNPFSSDPFSGGSPSNPFGATSAATNRGAGAGSDNLLGDLLGGPSPGMQQGMGGGASAMGSNIGQMGMASMGGGAQGMQVASLWCRVQG